MSLACLILVTHLLGAGHLTRAAALGRALAQAGHRVTLVSGGRPIALARTDGLTFVQLPPVQAALGDWSTLRDEAGAPASPELLARRRDLVGAIAERMRPDIVVTELYPFGRRGLAAEFEALLAAAISLRPRPLVATSVRDVLATPRKARRAEETEAALARLYDLVLVHGDPELVPLEASWPVGPACAARLRYTGYIDADPPSPDMSASDEPGGAVLVTGGSSAAALPLYRAALAAAARAAAGSRSSPPWHILVGHGVPEPDVTALRAASFGHARIERARPDFRALLRKSAVFVGQAGYNTVMDLFDSGARAVLVPFEAGGETEQRLRAERLAARGLARLLPEAELDGDRLAREVEAALAASAPAWGGVDRDGARASARILENEALLRRAARA